ncbi:MAG: CopG family transcriptional regulator [Chloroflexi bacterium]|nr:MAG: CopG family transcriptional regulator [Chloroflexota bacterium]
MPDTEKITINMSVVDLGQVDLLVEEGFYSSRTDFIRTSIRNQISQHGEAVRQSITRRTMALGATGYNRAELEKVRANGEKLEVRVVGLFMLQDDVTPELARDTIESVKVLGVFRAPEAVKAALADRILN